MTCVLCFGKPRSSPAGCLLVPLLRRVVVRPPPCAALSLLETREEDEDALVHPTEPRLRGDVAATFEELGQGEVGEDLPRPREHSPGGEERVLLGGEHRNRPTEAPEFLLGGRTGEVGVQPEVPEGGPELPDGGAEGGILGLREQRHRRALETLLGGTEAVEERRGADLDDHPQKGACGYACGGDERRPRDALWGQAHGPDCYGRPVREPHERRTLQAEAVEDVLHPEGVAVPLRRGPLLRAPARLADDVWRVEAVALGQRQKPLKAGGIQGVGSRQEDDGRGVLGSYRQDVGVAEACADCQALVAWAQPGQRLVVERSDLGLALWRFVDGFGRRRLPRENRHLVSLADPRNRVHPGLALRFFTKY